MLEIKNIGKTYPKKGKVIQALQDVSLCFEETGMTFILGKSGSGKSTLLNILGGLDSCTQGEMFVEGKRINDFKTRDYDDYRNQYVRFVFQEFHLLEEYNVYENILLSLQLQHQKPNHQEIDALLTKLEIADLKERKINELSGGQKQRVALARALIKKPKVILADEPTGNLDQKTGHEVMRLLQEISKDTLVIVVTHNEEYARMYGRRIIELQDGKVVADNKKVSNHFQKSNFTFHHWKLSSFDALKLGASFLPKKASSFFSLLLVTFSLLFLIICYQVVCFKQENSEQQMLKTKEIPFVEIKKKAQIDSNNSNPLNDDDIIDISKIVSVQQKVYSLPSENDFAEVMHLHYIQNPLSEQNIYYDPSMTIQIVETDFTDWEGKSVIGSLPKENNEIIISNYAADLILYYGIYEYATETVYFPQTYQELVNSNREFSFGSFHHVKIVGIINYNLSKFQTIKQNFKEISLKHEFLLRKKNVYNKIYGTSQLINRLKQTVNVGLNENHQYIVKLPNHKILRNAFASLDHETTYYDGKKWQSVTSLQENEMLLNISALVPDFFTYQKELNQYASQFPDQSYEQSERNFITSKFSLKDYLGKEVCFQIYENLDYYQDSENQTPSKEYCPVKIIGITTSNDESNHLLSQKVLASYYQSYLQIESVLQDQEIAKVMKIFSKHALYRGTSLYTEDGLMFESQRQTFQPLGIAVMILFMIFLCFLVFHFINHRIQEQKRNIGILRALGSRKIDVFKVILSEVILFVILSSFLLFVLFGLSIDILQYFYTQLTGFTLSVFFITPSMILFTIFFIWNIAFVSCCFLFLKIVKRQPIEVISKSSV